MFLNHPQNVFSCAQCRNCLTMSLTRRVSECRSRRSVLPNVFVFFCLICVQGSWLPWNRIFIGAHAFQNRPTIPSFINTESHSIKHTLHSTSVTTFVRREDAEDATTATSSLSRALAKSAPTTTSEHRFSSRKVAGRKAQLRWIAQTVTRIQNRIEEEEEEAMDGTNRTSNFRSIREHINQPIRDALSLLSSARSQDQVVEAGRILSSIDIAGTQPLNIQERIVKATAMTGLMYIALNITEIMLDLGHFPSEICQEALSDGLRRMGRLERLEKLLIQLGQVAQSCQQRLSVVAFNTFLAALCDVGTEKDVTLPQQAVINHIHRIHSIALAWSYVENLHTTQQIMAVVPDAVSYATVIQAASMVGNRTLALDIWKLLKERNIQTNIVAYNAQLRIIKDGGISKEQDFVEDSTNQRDKEILRVWDNEIVVDPCVKPDKYTIDLILLPLIRTGRIGELETILDDFVKHNSEKVVSDAFAAFLLTIVGGGEVSSARALFETYVLPTLSPVMVSEAGGMIRMVRPKTRHFNALLEGYRKEKLKLNKAEADEAWGLYQLLCQSTNVRPDEYTITSMMGLCRNTTELSNLLHDATSKHDITISSVVLRAALTVYGELGDPSSALWLFSKFAETSTRTCNVLLGALAANKDQYYFMKPSFSCVAKVLGDKSSVGRNWDTKDFLHVDTLSEAVLLVLHCMEGNMVCGRPEPLADSQSYCLVAASLQSCPEASSSTALSLFRNATSHGIPADGRFVNAVLRCFGEEIDSAIEAWKGEIRPLVLKHEQRSRLYVPPNRPAGKNLVAAYNGLLYVSGRAMRPNIALRLVYAMKKEGLEPNENSLNAFKSGKRHVKPRDNESIRSRLLKLIDPYESLLYVECMKYDSTDKRRHGERRVRIIV